jgi:hypothetical protein
VNKLVIWSNGISKDTHIDVVDDAGSVTPLRTVESIDFHMPTDGPVGQLRLGFLHGSVMEIEIPITGDAAARLVAVRPAWMDLHAALRRVPATVSALLPPWVDQLIRAARAIAGE